MSKSEERSQEDGTPADFKDQAERCRRLSHAINDRQTAEILKQMADNYDRGTIPDDSDSGVKRA